MKSFIDILYEKKELQKDVKKRDVKKWMLKLFKELNIDNSSCSIMFTTTETIQKLNKKYLDRDYPTDVISFSQVEGEKIDFINSNFLGDIVICLPYAEKQALKKKHSILFEIYFLLLHGLLHLLGYDHENDDKKVMDNIQNNMFYKITGEYIE